MNTITAEITSLKVVYTLPRESFSREVYVPTTYLKSINDREGAILSVSNYLEEQGLEPIRLECHGVSANFLVTVPSE